MPARTLVAVVACSLVGADGAWAADPEPALARPLAAAWGQATLAYHRLEYRVASRLIPSGVGEGFVHLLLGRPLVVVGPCGMVTATAIANNRPGHLHKFELYVRGSTALTVSYRCDEAYRWRVDEVTVRER
jgi:hypothetical protein